MCTKCIVKQINAFRARCLPSKIIMLILIFLHCCVCLCVCTHMVNHQTHTHCHHRVGQATPHKCICLAIIAGLHLNSYCSYYNILFRNLKQAEVEFLFKFRKPRNQWGWRTVYKYSVLQYSQKVYNICISGLI